MKTDLPPYKKSSEIKINGYYNHLLGIPKTKSHKKNMRKETHLSSCCREPIIVKGEGQGLSCSKCGSETFSTIIIEMEGTQKKHYKRVLRGRRRKSLLL